MHDTGTETATCPRHSARAGDPIWCAACRGQIHTAIVDLPDLHTRILEAAHTALTPTRAERRPVNADPVSPSPLYDFADEIGTCLRGWAQAWADHLGDPHPTKADPRASATYLVRHRKADVLGWDGALDLGREMTRLHGAAIERVGDLQGEPQHHRVLGVCPTCKHGNLYRVDGTEDVVCAWCGPICSRDVWAAYRALLAYAIPA